MAADGEKAKEKAKSVRKRGNVENELEEQRKKANAVRKRGNVEDELEGPRKKAKAVRKRGNVEDELEGPRKKAKAVGERAIVEDEVKGWICHNCRSKKFEDHVRCSRAKCKHKFCRMCLLNRHGENIDLERAEGVLWVCPKCRGGCGEGCIKSCCNCGPCRKARGLEVTGEVTVKVARRAGFTNIHDYLVHLETGDPPAAIADRKKGRGWTSIDLVSADIATVLERDPLEYEVLLEYFAENVY